MSVTAQRSTLLLWCAIALVGLLAAELALTAWQSDDAFITFRTVDNLFQGHGLRWNTDERVQTYTHPLWMLLAVACRAVSGELYFSTLILGALLTLTSAVLLWRLNAAAPLTGLAVLLVLLGSKAFVDYGTSGLENPLTGLLAMLLAWRLTAARPWYWVPTLAALLALTRPDAVLLALPAVLWSLAALRRGGGSARLAWLLGWLPLAGWLLFSTVYYGSAIPNTAWAKLNVQIPRLDLLQQGLRYLGDSLARDPLTLVAVAAGALVGFVGPRREARLLAAGAALYIAFVVWIGGDFMSGRFLTAPLVLALGALGLQAPHIRLPRRRLVEALCLVGLGGYALLWPASPLHARTDYGANRAVMGASGIADERAYYYPTTGALRVLGWLDRLESEGLPVPPYRGALRGVVFRDSSQRAAPYNETGFFGYFAGPDRRVVDVWALCDPLLARIPFRPGDRFRIGHFERPLPAGYLRSRERGENLLVDPELRAAYQEILRVVRGPLWTRERWRAIWRLNTGAHRRAFQSAAGPPRRPSPAAAGPAAPSPAPTHQGDPR